LKIRSIQESHEDEKVPHQFTNLVLLCPRLISLEVEAIWNLSDFFAELELNFPKFLNTIIIWSDEVVNKSLFTIGFRLPEKAKFQHFPKTKWVQVYATKLSNFKSDDLLCDLFKKHPTTEIAFSYPNSLPFSLDCFAHIMTNYKPSRICIAENARNDEPEVLKMNGSFLTLYKDTNVILYTQEDLVRFLNDVMSQLDFVCLVGFSYSLEEQLSIQEINPLCDCHFCTYDD
jgi:hypothetical protein